jgi:hypothetical protein
MENNFQTEDSYFKASKRVEKIKDFYGNLISFIVVNTGLFVINILTSPNYLWFDLWFYWQLLIWGIGVIFHGLIVFNAMPFYGKKWEEQKIKE